MDNKMFILNMLLVVLMEIELKEWWRLVNIYLLRE